MTPEQEMKVIVESVDGGCWHDWSGWRNKNGSLQRCSKCDAPTNVGCNPSPTDMNVLMEYAEKLGYPDVSTEKIEKGCYQAIIANGNHAAMGPKWRCHSGVGTTRADALRDALCQSLKENE